MDKFADIAHAFAQIDEIALALLLAFIAPCVAVYYMPRSFGRTRADILRSLEGIRAHIVVNVAARIVEEAKNKKDGAPTVLHFLDEVMKASSITVSNIKRIREKGTILAAAITIISGLILVFFALVSANLVIKGVIWVIFVISATVALFYLHGEWLFWLELREHRQPARTNPAKNYVVSVAGGNGKPLEPDDEPVHQLS